MPQMAGEFTLKKHNINPQKDLQLIQNIEFANIASAYASGTGEYVQLFEPQASIIEKEGKGFVVASFGVESGHLPYTVFMAKQSFMKANAGTVQKFTNAIQRAQLWVAAKSVDEITNAVLPYFKDIDVEIVKSVVKRYKDQGSFATDGIVDEQEWNNLLDVMTSAGELKEKVAWIARDERADLLRLAVVGVVVAAGQRVCAEDDAALDLGAEALLAGQRHDLLGDPACRRRRRAGRSAWRRTGPGWTSTRCGAIR